MSSLKLQGSRWMKIYPSDNAPIPYPDSIAYGTTTSTSSGKLVDSGATFIADSLLVGMIVYNTTDETAAVIDSIDSETQLTLNANIFTSGETYKIYNRPQDQGPCLYVGLGGNFRAVNVSGDSEIFKNVPDGSYHPIHVSQVMETDTDAEDIIAIW